MAGKQKKTQPNKKNNGSNAQTKPSGELALPPATPAKKVAQSPVPITPGGSSVQEYKQRQDDEVAVLEAIYMEDYTRVERTGAWNVRAAAPLLLLCLCKYIRVSLMGSFNRHQIMRSKFI